MLLNFLIARTHVVQPQGHVSIKEIPTAKGNTNVIQTIFLDFKKTLGWIENTVQS